MPPRPRRGHSAETSRGAAAGDVDIPWSVATQVRDSPMFRRQAEAFEASLGGLEQFLAEAATRLRSWTAAQRLADDEARKAAAWLRDRRHGRALFGGAHASLGGAALHCRLLADALDEAADRRGALARTFDRDVAKALDAFREEQLGDVAAYRGRDE